MARTGVFMTPQMENVESITFTDSTVWTIEIEKLDNHIISVPTQEVMVSSEVEGVAEWGGLKGMDRICCDRNQRQGSVCLLSSINKLDDSCDNRKPVVVFKFRGCEPVRIVSVGPVVIRKSDDTSVEVDSLDIESGWHDCASGVVEFDEIEFERVKVDTHRQTTKQTKTNRAVARRERRRDVDPSCVQQPHCPKVSSKVAQPQQRTKAKAQYKGPAQACSSDFVNPALSLATLAMTRCR